MAEVVPLNQLSKMGKLVKVPPRRVKNPERRSREYLTAMEVEALRWEQVDLKQGLLHVNRLKHGTAGTHPLRGPELRALRKLQRDYPATPYVFVSERESAAHHQCGAQDRRPRR